MTCSVTSPWSIWFHTYALYTIHKFPYYHRNHPYSPPLQGPVTLYLVSDPDILCGTVGEKSLGRSIRNCSALLYPLYIHYPSSTTAYLWGGPFHALPHPLGVLVAVSNLASYPEYQQNNICWWNPLYTDSQPLSSSPCNPTPPLRTLYSCY